MFFENDRIILFRVRFVVILIAMIITPVLFFDSDAFATPSTLTISVTDNISLSIASASSAGGFVHSDTTTSNISVSTNNSTGYTLGIKASSEGGNALVNALDSTMTIPSHTITAGVSETNYTDNTYASANNLNNTWGFRPSKYWDITNNTTIDNTSSNLYFPGPSSAVNSFIIDKTSIANSTDNEYNLAFGIRIDNDITPGIYSNTFVVTAIANPVNYSITYNANGNGNTVTNMPSNMVNQTTSGETVAISSTIPIRSNYAFQGWCTEQVADGDDCTGTSYSAGSNWTIDQTAATNSLILYARWKLAKIYIQDLTLTQCQKNVGVGGNSSGVGDTMTVYDRRDENDYTVRYINGNCWMTQNLRFQGTSIDSTTTNINVTKNLTWYDLTNASSDSSPCWVGMNYSTIAYYGQGYTNLCKHDSGNTTNGVWYNYAAASAGTIVGASSNINQANYSICPVGWRLPTESEQSGITSYSYAFSPVVGGGYDNGSINMFGTDLGYWWSATGKDDGFGVQRTRLVYASSDGSFSINGYGNFDRGTGSYIRCIRSS